MVPRDLQESFVLGVAAAFGHEEDKDGSENVLKQLQSTNQMDDQMWLVRMKKAQWEEQAQWCRVGEGKRFAAEGRRRHPEGNVPTRRLFVSMAAGGRGGQHTDCHVMGNDLKRSVVSASISVSAQSKSVSTDMNTDSLWENTSGTNCSLIERSFISPELVPAHIPPAAERSEAMVKSTSMSTCSNGCDV